MVRDVVTSSGMGYESHKRLAVEDVNKMPEPPVAALQFIRPKIELQSLQRPSCGRQHITPDYALEVEPPNVLLWQGRTFSIDED
jgi:hypothetical protein